MIKGFDKYPSWAYTFERTAPDKGYEFTRFVGKDEPDGDGNFVPGYLYDKIIRIKKESFPIDRRFLIYNRKSVYYGPAVEEGWTRLKSMTIRTKKNILNRIFAP